MEAAWVVGFWVFGQKPQKTMGRNASPDCPCYNAVAAWTLALETAHLRGALRGSNSTDELDVMHGRMRSTHGLRVEQQQLKFLTCAPCTAITARSRWFAVRIGEGEVWRLYPLAVRADTSSMQK